MIYSQKIYALLGPLVGGRCYPVMFPQSPLPTWPAIRYTATGGISEPTNCGDPGEEADTTAVQIDIVAQTYDYAATLSAQVRLLMATFDPVATMDSPPIPTYDDETKTFRFIHLWDIHGHTLP